MTAYVLRRLLIMIPTFFGISLIIFVVLNLAPGSPGAQQQADQASRLEDQATQESYRIFREQFGLDKPTLFNTWFALDEAEVRVHLEAIAGAHGGPAERVAAQEALEGYGGYAVPHLVRIARSVSPGASELEQKARDLAVYFLKLTARRPLIDPFNPSPNDETRERNREIESENAQFREWGFGLDASETDKGRAIAAWSGWFEQNAARFEYDSSDRVRIFFLDTRFARYWSNLSRLDFGVSLVSREPVMSTLLGKLKYSLVLSIGSLILAYLIAIPLGIFSAVRRDTKADRVLTVGLFMLYSLPSFFVATLLLYSLSQGASWEPARLFPTGGWQSTEAGEFTLLERWGDIAWHITLPLFCMTYGSLAAISRYMRSGLLEVIGSDYIRTAYAKGLPERIVIGKHALRNGLLPILTLLAGLLPAVLGGSVIIEYIFGIPGMGLWVVESIYQRDYNVIMAVQLLSTVLVLFGILLTDLSYALADPRIRYS
jgi:peptide/nickel transport system permease protein